MKLESFWAIPFLMFWNSRGVADGVANSAAAGNHIPMWRVPNSVTVNSGNAVVCAKNGSMKDTPFSES